MSPARIHRQIGLDLDGTLLAVPTNADYEDANIVATFEPIDSAVNRARSLRRQGCRLIVVTGRRQNLKDVTRLQVRILLGEGVAFVWAPEWSNPADLLEYKANALASLKGLGLDLYVGDSWTDQEAARRSGVCFLHARDFAAGTPLPPVEA